jgi:hypothetical protein
MKNGLYCFPKKINNKRSFIPISPQPAESDVVTLHSYYTTLKRQPDFKKRVTWFSNPDNQDLSTRAIVEYIGEVMTNNVVGIDGSSRIGIPGSKVVAELRFCI